ncbi:MAG: hypothetical protein P8I51_02295 [Polaribacter sp.]|jgi:hypothetical protein|nr:hypothetical protein [Polaribacter sp.]MDG1953707.1 hypothetical protein [Polaribacter sp.]
MSESTNKPNPIFWMIGIIALLWNSMGVDAYIQQAYNTERHQAMYPEPKQLEIVNNLPSWLTAVFAIAVFAGLLGCILMLFKKKMANLFFKFSLFAVIIQTIYNLFINEGKDMYGAFEYSMLISIPIAAIFLMLYSKKSTEKGWLS